MPIKCPLAISPLSEVAFAQIDHEVMGCAYASQNALGRLCEERVYENDLAARLRERGLKEVYTQAPIAVSHAQFSKVYRLDLVVSGMVYELKAVAAWAAEHETQAIHHAALLGTDRVKLVNFRPGKVAGKLVRCPVGRLDRTLVELISNRWQPLSPACEALRQEMSHLLADWGAYLVAQLYEEALVHFNGGEGACRRRVRVTREGLDLGTQRMACHGERMAFLVTAMTQEQDDYEQHLLRLLRWTGLEAIQWINLNHAQIEFITLRPGKGMEARE